MPIRSLLLALALSLASVPVAVRPPEATPSVQRAVAEHVAWVLSLFGNGADGLTADEIEARFDENFLRLVPPEEVIGITGQLAEELGPLELVAELPAEVNEHVAIYRAESGGTMMVSLAVNPATGRIAGFFIIPPPPSRGSATLAG